jgi:hypothetical protein
MNAGRFRPGDQVTWRAVQGTREFRGHVVRPLQHGRTLVDDGTGLPPIPVRDERLIRDCGGPSADGGSAA